MRLTEVLNDPYSSNADVGAVIGEDPGLTARLLRLVNSAIFGFPARIESITQALSLVGTQQIHDLALATSVLRLFKNVPEDFFDMDSFWRHSLACGICARLIAAQRREPNVERLFVAGLLHDIGRLVLCSQFPDGARAAFEFRNESGTLLYEAERAVLGFDHAAIGRALLCEWKLPAALLDVVANHHQPTKAHNYPAEVAIVHVADITAHALLLGDGGERYVPPLEPSAWDTLQPMETIPIAVMDEIDSQHSAALKTIMSSEAL
jgi:putative nucleotidyltransferase with HDIG domain